MIFCKWVIQIPAPTTPIDSGGTYAQVPHHLTPPPPPPPIWKKKIYPYLGYWLRLAITKTSALPGFLGKSSWDYIPKIPSFRRKWEHACDPLCIRVCVCVCVGGGGGVRIWFSALGSVVLNSGYFKIRPQFQAISKLKLTDGEKLNKQNCQSFIKIGQKEWYIEFWSFVKFHKTLTRIT